MVGSEVGRTLVSSTPTVWFEEWPGDSAGGGSPGSVGGGGPVSTASPTASRVLHQAWPGARPRRAARTAGTQVMRMTSAAARVEVGLPWGRADVGSLGTLGCCSPKPLGCCMGGRAWSSWPSPPSLSPPSPPTAECRGEASGGGWQGGPSAGGAGTVSLPLGGASGGGAHPAARLADCTSFVGASTGWLEAGGGATISALGRRWASLPLVSTTCQH